MYTSNTNLKQIFVQSLLVFKSKIFLNEIQNQTNPVDCKHYFYSFGVHKFMASKSISFETEIARLDKQRGNKLSSHNSVVLYLMLGRAKRSDLDYCNAFFS